MKLKFNCLRFAAPLFAVALALLTPGGATSTVSAQEPAVSCPTVRVSCPDTVKEGALLTFTADVSGGDPQVTPTFNWSISAGTISGGQGTSSITLDTTGIGGQTVTATVDVGGFSRECPASNSCSTSVEKVGPPVKSGEYVTRDLSVNKGQLDKFVLTLQQDPTAQGYLIAYGGRTSRPEDAQKAADKATDYTMNTLKLDGARTLSGVGGYREQPTVELWITPPGGMPPTGMPTVDQKDVKPAPAKPEKKRPTTKPAKSKRS